jgi:hypothetical protein
MSFFKSLDNLEEDLSQLDTNVTFTIVDYSYDKLLGDIRSGRFSPNKIQSLIKFSIRDLLDYSNFEKVETRSLFQALWTEPKFLLQLYSLLNKDTATLELIISMYKYEINKLIYDYLSLAVDTKDNEVTSIYSNIASIVNAKDIIPLTSIMPPDSAKLLVVSRYSSLIAEECVKNFNSTIVFSNADFSLKDIIYIYSRFYADDFSQLFCTTMTYEIEPTTDNGKRLNDRISFALLYILESMTSGDIDRTLMRYNGFLTLYYPTLYIRFSLRGLSKDFERVSDRVEYLCNEGIIIP